MGKDLGGVAARESRFPGVAKAAKRTGPSPSKRLPLCFPLLLLSAIWLFGGMAVGRAQEGVGGASLPAYVATKHVAVSYTDPLRSLEMLKVFGYNTTEPGKPLDVSKLPTVMVVPSTKFDQLPDETKRNFPQTETDRTTDLLVFYHRDKPEQLGILIDRMRTIVDVPARQIMIEALVLEISSSALEELGVEWELNRSALSSGNMLSKYTSGDLRIGNLAMEDGASIIDPTLDATLVDIFGEFETQLQALILDKSARVLSRPSVLTLDNRMAYINVSERIPVGELRVGPPICFLT